MAKTKTKFRWQVLVAVELTIIMVAVLLNAYLLWYVPKYSVDYELCGLLNVECPGEVQFYDFQQQMREIAEYKLSRVYVIEVISEVARQEGLDKEMMIAVARCESKLFPQARNLQDPHGGAVGLWQIILYWHPTVDMECAEDIWCSTRYFAKRYKQGDAGLWSCYNLYVEGKLKK